jgi:DNA replication protein DnaC
MKPLKERLSSLGLRHTSDTLDDLVATATKRRWGPTELLEAIADQESQDKARRSVERRRAHSRLGALTPMASFDWGWPKRIDRAAVDSALQLDFLARPANVVLVAPQGLGKTMIAQNIAYNAVQAGHSVLFTTASQLLLDLGCQDSARALDRRLKHYCSQAGLLVIDEIGYLSYDARSADLLFQVVSRRYEKKPIVLTTNLPFSEWPSIFPNAACAVALIDRVIHHASIISIEGDSYRRRVAEESRSERKAKKS